MSEPNEVRELAPIGRKWTWFSLAFGVLGPIACFATASASRLFANSTIGMDVYAAICVGTLIAWFVGGRGSAKFSAFASGTFLAAAFVAVPALLFTFVAALLAFGSLPPRGTLVVLAMLLGVQPAISLFIFGRNAFIADARADALAGAGTLQGHRVLGFATPFLLALLAFETPGEIQSICFRRVIDEIPNNERVWIDACRVMRWGMDWRDWEKSRDDDLARTDDPAALARAERIAAAYAQITGDEIEHWNSSRD